MQIKRNCKSCGNPFIAGRRRQLYCKRSCFKQAYYNKKKLEEASNFPLYRCPTCDNMVKLTFDPKKDKKWDLFHCPICRASKINIGIIVLSDDIFLTF